MVGLGVHAAAGDKVGLTDIRNAAIDITVDMFIDSCAQKLGVEYKLKEIDYLTHKFGHFGVGAFKGAISNLIQGERVLEGALVGGAAGAGAEILGEKLNEQPRRKQRGIGLSALPADFRIASTACLYA